MIEYIKGELTDLTPTMAVLETAGVGYEYLYGYSGKSNGETLCT